MYHKELRELPQFFLGSQRLKETDPSLYAENGRPHGSPNSCKTLFENRKSSITEHHSI